jgi:peptide/nickel transport system permease protein
VHIVAGDPAQVILVILGDQARRETILAMRVRIDLDPPLPVQYFAFFGGALRGDRGDSAWLSVSPDVAILIVTF